MPAIPLFWLNSVLGLTLTTALISPPPPKPVDILFVGDIMLGRYVETLMTSQGQDYPFRELDNLLSKYDMVVGNLEGPIPLQHTQTPNASLSFSFSRDVAKTLQKHYFTHLSLANNHTLDKGVDDFERTMSILREAGITPFGHAGEESAGYVAYEIIHDQPMTLIGFHSAVRQLNDTAAITVVKEVSSSQSFDIVFIHWGSEYVLHSNQRQQELAHALLDAGADVIIGHHPHVVQEIEVYNGKYIFYSLGNYIFDQYFSEDTQSALAVGITLSADTAQYALFPLRSNRSQPSLMKATSVKVWLENLAKRSSPELSTVIQEGEWDVSSFAKATEDEQQ